MRLIQQSSLSHVAFVPLSCSRNDLDCLGILVEVGEVQLLEFRAYNGLLPHTYGGSDLHRILGDLI
jgi:hypothetical protein